MVKATYGTGSSIMMNIGKKRLRSQQGLVTSLAWGLDGEVEYVLEGNINCTGATIKWVVEALGLIPDAESAGRVASALSGNEGVYLVPAFVGLNAPYWDSEAKAAILGLAMGIGKEHIVRAAVESIAYQIKDVLEVMVGESAIKLQELRVDGGPTRNDFLMQFQADLINASVLRNRLEELSAAGVAYMAGLAMGVWQDKAEIASLQVQDRIFSTAMSTAERDRLYGGWQEAVKRVLTKG
jgi:glycerol kinase